MARPTIAFDLDGTLVDTAPDLLRALHFVLQGEGLAEIRDDEARNFVGAGARAMIERALAFHEVQIPKEKVDAMLHGFLIYYEDHIADYSKPFPGVKEALAELNDAGVLLVVCTNKIDRLATKLIATLGLADCFAGIAGGDTFPYQKPDPRHLTDTIERAGGNPLHALLVGDSETDVITARAAEIPIVAVSFGYTDIPPAALGADRLIHKFDELPVVAKELLARKAVA